MGFDKPINPAAVPHIYVNLENKSCEHMNDSSALKIAKSNCQIQLPNPARFLKALFGQTASGLRLLLDMEIIVLPVNRT
jgi:hypothetical protein